MQNPIATDLFIAEAERVGANRRSDAAWLAGARQQGLQDFRERGLPTTRDEDWRFTSVAPIAESRFVLPANGASSLQTADLAPFQWDGDRSATLVFVNGGYVAAASNVRDLPAGVRVENLSQAMNGRGEGLEAHLTRLGEKDRRSFTALNTAFLADGAFVFVPDGTAVPKPIHLLFLSIGEGQPTMTHPRVLVVAGATSEVTIVESYGACPERAHPSTNSERASRGPARAERYLTNAVTEMVAGDNATITHYKIQREHPDSFHMAAMYLHAARNSTVASHSISLGGALVRNDIVAVLDGEGAHCTLNGLYLSDGSRIVDNHTTIDHAKPHCDSREVYKGILADRARAVFNGKIVVRPDAQKTDAKQTNKALLLSEDAQINTKPQLEIFANDVKCTHGAAVGQMDDDAIFYLRARGLGAAQARDMLVHAFAGDVLNHMPLAPLRARIDEELSQRLARWRT
jgi:Fe-S cluster assembly protein SufD